MDEGSFDELLRREGVQVVLNREGVVVISGGWQVPYGGGRGSQQSDGVGPELTVLFKPSVGPRCTPVQAQHELKILVSSLLVRERSVMRVFVL